MVIFLPSSRVRQTRAIEFNRATIEHTKQYLEFEADNVIPKTKREEPGNEVAIVIAPQQDGVSNPGKGVLSHQFTRMPKPTRCKTTLLGKKLFFRDL